MFPFVVATVIIHDLLICAFQYVHHFIVAQVVPELRGDLYDVLILVVFEVIFDQEALQGVGDDQSSEVRMNLLEIRNPKVLAHIVLRVIKMYEKASE